MGFAKKDLAEDLGGEEHRFPRPAKRKKTIEPATDREAQPAFSCFSGQFSSKR